MAAKIGILGESTVTSTGTVTVYTVPADKAARVKVIFAFEGGGGTYQYSIIIGSPGSEWQIHMNAASGDDLWSGSKEQSTPDPTLSVLSSMNGVQEEADGIDIDNLTFQSNVEIIAPLDEWYFLSTGDTVRMNISGTAGVDHLFQVVGVEDDA